MATTQQSPGDARNTTLVWEYRYVVRVSEMENQSSTQSETSDASSTEEETETETEEETETETDDIEEIDMLHAAPLHRQNALGNLDDYENIH